MDFNALLESFKLTDFTATEFVILYLFTNVFSLIVLYTLLDIPFYFLQKYRKGRKYLEDICYKVVIMLRLDPNVFRTFDDVYRFYDVVGKRDRYKLRSMLVQILPHEGISVGSMVANDESLQGDHDVQVK